MHTCIHKFLFKNKILISNAAQNQRECHYRQLMQVQHTLNRLDVFSEVIISSPHVSQTASFSLVLVKYRHTRLLLRMDVELLLLASCSEDNTLLLVAIFTTHGGFA